MNRLFKSVLVLFLSVMTVLNITGIAAEAEETTGQNDVYVYTEEDNALLEADVFAKIQEVKAEAAVVCGGIGHLTEADYVAMIPAVIEAIEASDTYVPGTLQANGNFLVWETTTGIPCCYDPRMEAKLHNTDDDPTQEEIDAAEAEAEALLEEYASINGGFPGSTNIGLIQPYWESANSYLDYQFLNYSPYYKTMWQNLYTATGGQGIRYSLRNATVDNIASTMEQCGLVIFDSHGTTDYDDGNEDYTSRANCSYLCIETTTGITSQDTAAQQGPFGRYYHAVKGDGYADISGTCIGYHMTQNAPNSALYMGICLGMATDGMHKGLRAKGVEVCYGYSQSVTFYGERIYMQSILDYVKNGETFGDAVMKTKQEHGNWDPAYEGETIGTALSEKAAFPIVVSSEDVYPGHGNVDAVQNVYSAWTLYKQFDISAVPNDSSYGSVSVSGSRITAVPNEGYYVEGYEILSGTAEVVQNGNEFKVSASSDCVIQINFAMKKPAAVTYMADGTKVGTVYCLTKDTIALPDSADTPEGWTFVGWSSKEVELTASRPAYYSPGASYVVNGDAVLYAVYSMTEGYRDDVYELVTGTLPNWYGRFVITTGNDENMQVMKGLVAGKSYESAANGGAVSFADTGMTFSGRKLYDVTDAYTFDVARNSDYYSIQSTATGAFLAVNSKKLQTVKTFASTCRWTPGMVSSKAYFKSASSNRYITYANDVFCAATSTSGLYIWKQSPQGTDYYTTQVTEPQEKPSFYGTSIVLSGQIGMNFYVTIPEAYQSSGRMVFRTGNREDEAIPASEVSHDGTLYHFTCGVNSVEMADTITAVFMYEDGGQTKEITLTTSVESYLHTIVDQAGSVAAYQKAENLAKALNNYGYYAQLSLSDGPNHVQMTGLYNDLALPSEIEGFDVTFTSNNTVTQGSFSLNLDSRTTLNFYLSPYDKVSAAHIVVTDRYGNVVTDTTKTQVGNWCLLSIPDISAHMLGDTYKVTVNELETISASALSYVQLLQTNDSASQDAKNTAMALYGYYLQAIDYLQ